MAALGKFGEKREGQGGGGGGSSLKRGGGIQPECEKRRKDLILKEGHRSQSAGGGQGGKKCVKRRRRRLCPLTRMASSYLEKAIAPSRARGVRKRGKKTGGKSSEGGGRVYVDRLEKKKDRDTHSKNQARGPISECCLSGRGRGEGESFLIGKAGKRRLSSYSDYWQRKKREAAL